MSRLSYKLHLIFQGVYYYDYLRVGVWAFWCSFFCFKIGDGTWILLQGMSGKASMLSTAVQPIASLGSKTHNLADILSKKEKNAWTTVFRPNLTSVRSIRHSANIERILGRWLMSSGLQNFNLQKNCIRILGQNDRYLGGVWKLNKLIVFFLSSPHATSLSWGWLKKTTKISKTL